MKLVNFHHSGLNARYHVIKIYISLPLVGGISGSICCKLLWIRFSGKFKHYVGHKKVCELLLKAENSVTFAGSFYLPPPSFPVKVMGNPILSTTILP